MALALEARAKADDILIGDTPKAKRRKRRLEGVQSAGRLWKHSTLADVEGLVTRQQMADWFVFALVRNPWDRMVSYYHWLRAQTFDNPAVTLAGSLAFDAFVQHPQTLASFRANPARRYMTDGVGTEHADHFIRLENLAEDLEALTSHLGFRPDMGHENASERSRAWRDYYSDAAAEAVAEACAEDIQRFGYRFDG